MSIGDYMRDKIFKTLDEQIEILKHKGMKIEDVIKKLKGIPCRNRGTSCPDQLAIALEKIKQERENA